MLYQQNYSFYLSTLQMSFQFTIYDLKFDSKWWQVILMCYETCSILCQFSWNGIILCYRGNLAGLFNFSVHVTHVMTLHTCRSSFGFYIWQINVRIYLWYLLVILLAFSLWTYQNQKCTFKFIEQIILDGHPACMESYYQFCDPYTTHDLITIPIRNKAKHELGFNQNCIKLN